MQFFKNKTVIKVLLFFSIIINFIFIKIEIYDYNLKKSVLIPITFNKSDSTLSVNTFKDIIKKRGGDKPFFYYNTWTTYCAPCIKEMPLLDSLLENKKKYFDCIFLTDASQILVEKLIKRKNLKIKNFSFESDNLEFLKNILKYKKNTSIIYPTHLIFNSRGEVIYYSEGDLETQVTLIKFGNVLDSLINSVRVNNSFN